MSITPQELGFVRNSGNVSTILHGIIKGGVDPALFDMWVEYRSVRAPIEEVVTDVVMRVELRPNEEIVIGGTFRPDPASPHAPASCAIGLLDPDRGVRASLNVEAFPVSENAQGDVLPDHIRFGQVPHTPDASHPPARHILVVSNGTTPLLVTNISISDPKSGFEVGQIEAPADADSPWAPANQMLYQIDSGGEMTIEVRLTPQRNGPAEASLVVDTNVGLFSVRLTALADDLKVDPLTHPILFSPQEVGWHVSLQRQPITITNIGAAALRLVDLRVTEGRGATSPHFRLLLEDGSAVIPALARVLHAFEQLDIYVEFEPKAPGLHRASLAVRTSDPGQPASVVTIEGEGFTS